MNTKEQQAQEYAKKKSIALRKAWYLYRYGGMYTPDDWARDTVRPSDNFECGFNAGYTACEQSMTDSEATVTQGWVARDNNGELYIYSEKPKRLRCLYWAQGDAFLPISPELFPSLTWSDEPIECEITIKPKRRTT